MFLLLFQQPPSPSENQEEEYLEDEDEFDGDEIDNALMVFSVSPSPNAVSGLIF
jgi:hypothetical protein